MSTPSAPRRLEQRLRAEHVRAEEAAGSSTARLLCDSAAKFTTTSMRSSREHVAHEVEVADVALDERDAVEPVEVAAVARVREEVERDDVVVRRALDQWRTKFEPMKPAAPVTRSRTRGHYIDRQAGLICLTWRRCMHTLTTVTKRTSINLDFDLVEEAKTVLDTRGTTETIHRALSEVVRQARLERLVRRRFELQETDLVRLRRSRTDETGPVSVSARSPA